MSCINDAEETVIGISWLCNVEETAGVSWLSDAEDTIGCMSWVWGVETTPGGAR